VLLLQGDGKILAHCESGIAVRCERMAEHLTRWMHGGIDARCRAIEQLAEHGSQARVGELA
jgi:hypothetical protein